MLTAMLAAGQTAPVAQPETVAGKASDPVVVKPLETSTKPGSDLEFKPPAEKDPPPPAPAVPPATVNKAAEAKAKKAEAVPATGPEGPRVAEAPPGPVVLPEAPAGVTQPVAGALPAIGQGRPATPGPVRTSKPYVIGPLDVLEVKVWNDPKLSGMVDVATDGTITLPLIGPVVASGLTVAELTVGLKEKLLAVIIEPEVNVQVLRINSKKYSIFGGCLRSGEFPLVGDVTILDAFASCGGFKEFSNLKKIYVLRGTEKLKFNYQDVIRGKHMEQNILLENGDRIVVPE